MDTVGHRTETAGCPLLLEQPCELGCSLLSLPAAHGEAGTYLLLCPALAAFSPVSSQWHPVFSHSLLLIGQEVMFSDSFLLGLRLFSPSFCEFVLL